MLRISSNWLIWIQIDSCKAIIPEDSTRLSGIAVSEGVVIGIARVIKHFETEAHLIRKNEILVTDATDTGGAIIYTDTCIRINNIVTYYLPHLINAYFVVSFCFNKGWTPYFPLLSGVVTELGGMLSHGAVVAREYGLPAVAGVLGATEFFKSGETIVLDGNKGVVFKQVTSMEPLEKNNSNLSDWTTKSLVVAEWNPKGLQKHSFS